LVDWRGNFDPLNVFAVVPLLMLCPIALLALRRRNRLRDQGFGFVALAWLAAFGYATFVALAHGSVVPAIFAVAQFCLPLVIGAWLLTREETLEVAHARIARALLVFGAIAGAYGLFQYVVAPPWDTAWMQSIDAESFGTPERFGIRVFGVLNGPGVFALFVGSVIVFNLPYLRLRSTFNMVAVLLMTVGLMLSLVRSAWVVVFCGIAIFVLLSPKRWQALFSVISASVVCAVAALGVLVVSPNADISDKLLTRFTTLSNVGDDPSALERRQAAEDTFNLALEQPVGAGLGLTGGGGGKLSNADAQFINHAPVGPIDNGFAARFFEMGVPGFAAFLIACCGSLAVLARAYEGFVARRDRTAAVLAAGCIATQVVLFLVNMSGDDQQGILGVLFFAALALPLMASNKAQADLRLQPVPAKPYFPSDARRAVVQ
jgi:hypothetical protein